MLRSLIPILALSALGLAGCGDKCIVNGVNICDDTGDTGDEGGVPNAVVDPCGWDFGSVEVNSVTSKSMSVKNTGNAILEIISITADSPFTPGGGGGITIEEGNQYQFTVRFEPTTYGSFEGTLAVETDDPDNPVVECALSGMVNADADGDGYDSADAGGDDCDDSDPEVHPGAEEKWYDGIDQDCDEHSDYDQDYDGYDSDVFNEDPETNGGDCVDANDQIYPGAPDEWYDGVDSNCDGINDYDADDDTWTSAEYGGEDCDDTDSDVNPDGTESFNGKDDDCDGVTDNDALADEADDIVYGDSTVGGTRAGYSLAVGDWDGDGTADVAIGVPWYGYSGYTALQGEAQGEVAIYMNESWSDNDEIGVDTDWEIEGEDSMAELGGTVANIGDWDDDGIDDLAISAPAYDSKAGRVYLFSGPDVETADYTDAILTLTGEDDMQVGLAMAESTDLDGDGLADLISYSYSRGAVYNYVGIQYGGGDAGDYEWDDMDATFRQRCGTPGGTSTAWCGGTASGSTMGGTETFAANIHAGADLDGDGYDDLLLGDQYNDDEAAQAGRVWVLWGASTQYSNASSSLTGTTTTLVLGENAKGLIGKYVHAAPDADGDGDAELWILDGKNEVMYWKEGGTDLTSGSLDLSTDFDAEIDFSAFDDITGWSNVGDWTGDAVDDIGVAFGDEGYVAFFESEILSGSVDGETLMAGSLLAATDLDGDESDDGEYFGRGLPLIMRNLDSDTSGSVDLLVGDYGLYSSQGGVFFFSNDR